MSELTTVTHWLLPTAMNMSAEFSTTTLLMDSHLTGKCWVPEYLSSMLTQLKPKQPSQGLPTANHTELGKNFHKASNRRGKATKKSTAEQETQQQCEGHITTQSARGPRSLFCNLKSKLVPKSVRVCEHWLCITLEWQCYVERLKRERTDWSSVCARVCARACTVSEGVNE